MSARRISRLGRPISIFVDGPGSRPRTRAFAGEIAAIIKALKTVAFAVEVVLLSALAVLRHCICVQCPDSSRISAICLIVDRLLTSLAATAIKPSTQFLARVHSTMVKDRMLTMMRMLILTSILWESKAFVTKFASRSKIGTSRTGALAMVLVTPPSKYPTERGTTVDSRKIVSNKEHLQAIRLNHILFASEELAQSTLLDLRAASLAFDELAAQISMCTETREEGGSIGWMAIHEGETNVNEHLDALLPPEARQELLAKQTKVRNQRDCTKGNHCTTIS